VDAPDDAPDEAPELMPELASELIPEELPPELPLVLMLDDMLPLDDPDMLLEPAPELLDTDGEPLSVLLGDIDSVLLLLPLDGVWLPELWWKRESLVVTKVSVGVPPGPVVYTTSPVVE
jgi:hypothetical protein